MGQNFLTSVGSFFCCSGEGSGQVSHLWAGFGKFSNPLDQKNLFGLGQRWVGLLFTAAQNNARLGSGLISIRVMTGAQ